MSLALHIGDYGIAASFQDKTWPSLDIGSAAENRTVYAVLMSRRTLGENAATAVTFGSIAGTLVDSVVFSRDFVIEFWSAGVSSGTAIDVLEQHPYINSWGGIQLYSIYGNHVVNDSSGSPFSFAVTNGGIVICSAVGSNAGPSATWTDITEDLDIDSAASSDTLTTASKDGLTAGTFTPTLSMSGLLGSLGLSFSESTVALRGIPVYGANFWRPNQPRVRGLYRRG